MVAWGAGISLPPNSQAAFIRYLAVVPYSEDPEAQLQQDGQLIIMRVDEDEEGEYLDIVDDDEELVDVSKMFETRLREIFDIDDSDL